MRVPRIASFMEVAFGLCVAVGIAFSLGAQDGRSGPTVFRKLTLGDPFPDLEVVDLNGKESALEAGKGKTAVLAFLRLDQKDSMQMFAALEVLALRADRSGSEIVVIGMHGGEGWRKQAKAMPRRMQLLLDRGSIGDQLGVIVLPSMAILDEEGLLQRAHVLYDDELIERVQSELELIEAGEGSELAADESLRLRFTTMKRNASALEAVGQLKDALAMRRKLVSMGLEAAQAQVDLGRTLFSLGEIKEAADCFASSIDLEYTVATSVWLGRALARTGAEENATQILTEALPLTPQKAVVHHELAEIFKSQGKIDLALEHMKAAIAAARKARGGAQ